MGLIDAHLKIIATFRKRKKLGWEGGASVVSVNFICLQENLKEMMQNGNTMLSMRKVQEHLHFRYFTISLKNS